MMRYVLSILLLFMCSIGIAYAASSDFTIRTKVGADIQPPTTPVNLIADPVAYSQINLSWGASTDDFLLSGYQVFRNSIQIATTTLTTFSDSGLSASTTYAYYIKAFDNVYNISSSSNIATATTPSPAATSTPAIVATSSSTVQGGSAMHTVLQSFAIIPSQYEAKVSWQTNTYVQFELRWGRTSSYELGFVTNELFTRTGDTSITDLSPGTVYQYELIAYDKNGVKSTLSEGQFKTTDAPDTTAPANVSNLRAHVVDGTVDLSWIDPSDKDFAYVRVVRSYFFYPTDPFDGYIAYQDSGTSFTDAHALDKESVQYYTVFSYDTHGNISSGAVVAAYRQNVATPGVLQATSSESATATVATSIPLTYADLQFVQNGTVVDSSHIDQSLPVTVRIAYDKLPEYLKIVVVSLSEPNDPQRASSFLLRINNDKTYYETTIAALQDLGVYPVMLSVYDTTQNQSARVTGSITVVEHQENMIGTTIDTHTSTISRTVSIVLLLLLLIIAYGIYQQLKKIGFIGEAQAQGTFNTTKFTVSVLLLFVFGALFAYLLTKMLSTGSTSMQDASVGASGDTFSGVFITFLLLAVVIALVVVLALITHRPKK